MTGFDNPPDSMPPSDYNGMNNAAKAGDSSMTSDQIRRLVGAPVLDVTEVRDAHLTIRPAECSGRPERPHVQTVSDPSLSPWPNASADCPSWFLDFRQTSDQGACDDAPPGLQDPPCWVRWDLDVTTPGSPGAAGCEPGSCYFIDFEISLGGPDASSRTVFGNPPNADDGWSEGVFFVYDPEIDVESSKHRGGSSSSDDGPWWWIFWILFGVAVLGILSTVVWWVVQRKKGTGGAPTESNALLGA